MAMTNSAASDGAMPAGTSTSTTFTAANAGASPENSTPSAATSTPPMLTRGRSNVRRSVTFEKSSRQTPCGAHEFSPSANGGSTGPSPVA